MSDYILRNLPIRFSSDFKYGREIEEALRRYVTGYKSARVTLKIERKPSVVVEKPNIPDLDPPIMGPIQSSSGSTIAYYWACLVSGSDAISSRDFHKLLYQKFAGITFKIKGFSIGDRNVARQYIQRIPDWWTGEIYVIDKNVIPTSARDDFEAGKARDELERRVRELLNGQNNAQSFQRLALNAQAQRAADRIFAEHQEKLAKIEAKIESGSYDRFQIFAELEDVLRVLNRHRRKSSTKEREEQVLKKAKSLQNRAKKDIDTPVSEATRKLQATKAAMDDQDIASATERSTDKAERADEAPATVIPDEPIDNSRDRTVIEVIETSGWLVSDDDVELIQILSAAIVDVLGIGSDAHRRLIAEIQERLAETLGEA